MTCIYCRNSEISVNFQVKPHGSMTDSDQIKSSISKYVDNYRGDYSSGFIECPECSTEWRVTVKPVYISSDSLPWAYNVILKL